MNFKKLDPKAKAPTKNNPQDAGYDLYALEDVEVHGTAVYSSIFSIAANLAGQNGMSEKEIEQMLWTFPDYVPSKIKTGIALEIPDGHVGLICDRSGMGSKGFKVMGGVIDSIYRGDVTVCLTKVGNSAKIKAGDKIAQIVILPIANPELVEVEELTDTARGEKGFGSSGR